MKKCVKLDILLIMNDIDIKRIREKLGISQEALAEMVGVHPRTAINIENQCFINYVHENVHELPRKRYFRGFFMPKSECLLVYK